MGLESVGLRTMYVSREEGDIRPSGLRRERGCRSHCGCGTVQCSEAHIIRHAKTIL